LVESIKDVEKALAIDDEERLEKQLQGLRNVFSDNTVYDRVNKILCALNKETKILTRHRVCVVCNRITKQLKRDFREQTYEAKVLKTRKEWDQSNDDTSRFVAFWDDKYRYGKNYLEDMMNTFKYTDVDFVTQVDSLRSELFKDGKTYDFVHSFDDEARTVFNLSKQELQSLIASKKGKGFCIDSFEVEKK
jgi:hypothetical protein